MSSAPLFHQHISGTSATDHSIALAGDFRNLTNVAIGTRESSRPPKPSSTIPFRRDPDFVDRGDLLSRVDERCSQPAGRAALVGLGGVGKSQLAIEYGYRVRERSPQTWIFWVHAGIQARFEEGYRKIAEVARIHGWDDPTVNILRLVRSWLCDESNGQWLMIVDNADNFGVLLALHDEPQTHAINSLDRPTESLSEFLPQSANGSVLITSRSRDAAFRLTGRHTDILGVDPMDQTHALALVPKEASRRL